MENDKDARAMKKKIITVIKKAIFDHKTKFCFCSAISPLASSTRKEMMRERKGERNKYRESQGERRKERLWVHTFNLSQYNTSF